jgi:hypothetical protein
LFSVTAWASELRLGQQCFFPRSRKYTRGERKMEMPSKLRSETARQNGAKSRGPRPERNNPRRTPSSTASPRKAPSFWRANVKEEFNAILNQFLEINKPANAAEKPLAPDPNETKGTQARTKPPESNHMPPDPPPTNHNPQPLSCPQQPPATSHRPPLRLTSPKRRTYNSVALGKLCL